MTPNPMPQAAAIQNRRSFATLRAVLALVLREMSTSYGRSPGGYLWAVVEPSAGIALLSLVFSATFRTPPLGHNFPIFYASGFLPFIMFNDVASKVSQSLNYSRQLLAYPTVTFVDALIARAALNLMTHVMVGVIVLGGVLLIFNTHLHPNLAQIFEAYALTGALALGVGTFNCFMFTRFPVYQQLWAIVMRPMFILSGVIFLFDSVPEKYQAVLWYNPLVHVVGLMRRGFYDTYDAEYASPVYVVLWILISLTFGLLLLKRNHRDLLNR